MYGTARNKVNQKKGGWSSFVPLSSIFQDIGDALLNLKHAKGVKLQREARLVVENHLYHGSGRFPPALNWLPTRGNGWATRRPISGRVNLPAISIRVLMDVRERCTIIRIVQKQHHVWIIFILNDDGWYWKDWKNRFWSIFSWLLLGSE